MDRYDKAFAALSSAIQDAIGNTFPVEIVSNPNFRPRVGAFEVDLIFAAKVPTPTCLVGRTTHCVISSLFTANPFQIRLAPPHPLAGRRSYNRRTLFEAAAQAVSAPWGSGVVFDAAAGACAASEHRFNMHQV